MYDHLTDDPFRGSEAVAAGLTTIARLRGPEFVTLFRGIHVGSSVPVDTRVRVRAVALRAGPDAVIAGPLAATTWCADCPWDDAEVIAPTDRRVRKDGIALHVARLPPSEVAERHGVAVTTPRRTAFDLARHPGECADVLAAVDALGHACGFGPAALTELLAAHPRVRGAVAVRRAAALMDPRAESLMETRTRLSLVLRGVPPPVSQHEVTLPNGRTVRLDLAWPGAKVAVEYDGADHRSITRHGLDIDRDVALEALGWKVIHVTARQVYRAPDELARRVGRALGSAIIPRPAA